MDLGQVQRLSARRSPVLAPAEVAVFVVPVWESSHVLEGLKAEVAALHARDFRLGAESLGPELLELREQILSLNGLYLKMLEAFDGASGYDDEHLSSAGWLQAQTTASAGEAHADQRAARLRRKLPKLAAAADRGEISQAHLTAVAAGIRDLPPELWD